ncbi:MAG: hypothetical protein KHY08_11360 [Lachnospiraceae bacterium]|nr:hypothetical protein [Lachnospiraceae bacterium]
MEEKRIDNVQVRRAQEPEQQEIKNWETEGLEVEGLTEEEARKVNEIFRRFVKAYEKSEKEEEEFVWLEKQLKIELPEKSDEEIQGMKEEIITSIREYDTDLNDLTEKMERGISKERWFSDRLEEGAKGVAVNAYGNYLDNINHTMEMANQQMLNKVLRADGGVKECINLDGFIAEQHQVNSFNAEAALRKSDFYAEIPKEGEVFGKNSFDVVIKSRKEPGIIHQYQFKFGKNAKATEQLLKSGNYNNQRFVVPSDQVKDVQMAFPGKSVTDHIGGTDKVDISSKPLTKDEVKKLQIEAQETGKIPRTDWNIYNTRELALNLGKQAGMAGVQAALVTTGIDLAARALQGEEIEGSEVVATAIKAGADTGVKAAAGGALTVASQKGVLSVLPPGTPAGTIAKIACVGIENVKIMWKVAKGELTLSEAMEHMGRTTTSMVAGMSCAGVGAGIGAAALSFIPVIGPIAGGLIGGIAGYAAGSKVGETVFNGAKKIARKGKELVGRAVEGIKNIGSSIMSGIHSLLSW